MPTAKKPTGRMFSGYLRAQQGFNAPEPFDGPVGWTVYKQQQTEIYVVTHNLGLANPERDLHVTVTAKDTFILPLVSVTSDSFTIQTWQLYAGVPQAPAPAASDLMFVAAYCIN